MRKLIGFSLKRKFAMWMMTIIVIVAGLYSGLTMKQESLPNLSFPYLSVTTIVPGAAPDAVVSQVTDPLEQRFINIDGVKNVTSTSMENVSSIILEFNFGQDMDSAINQIREAAAGAALPEGTTSPTINKFSINSFPVISLSASGAGELDQLTKIVKEEIQPQLEGISGVASVQIAGQYVQEVTLKYDDAKLAQYGLTKQMISGIIQGSSLKVPLGLFEIDHSEKAVVVDGRIVTIDDLRKLSLPVMSAGAEGAPVMSSITLDEVADIAIVGKAESISRTNGKESIGIQIVKANDANTVEVVNDVKAEMKQINEKYKDIKLDVLLDQGKPIEESVSTMLSKALFGAIFAVIVIMLFLRNIRTTLISIVSIPLSLIIALLLLKQFDITLNIMTLGAMTVAIGRVVDDSIVVIENIYRRMSLRGERLKGHELIVEATKEMFIPIMSSTIVTVAVFLPLGLVSGMVGQLFLPFALTIVFALLASLLVAVTIVPMLAHQMFKNGVKQGKGHDHEEHVGYLSRQYRHFLLWGLNHKLITLLVAFVVLIGSIIVIVPAIGASFLPDQEEKNAMLTYSPAPGDTLEDVKERALIAEKYLLEQSDIEKLQYSIGGSNPLQMGTSKSGLFYMLYKSDTKDFTDKKAEVLDGLRELVPQGDWNEMAMGAGIGGSGFSLGVYGDTLEEIKPVIDEVVALMSEDAAFADIKTSLSKTYEQYTIVADQKKLSQVGLTAGQIAMELSPVRHRPILTTVQDGGNTHNVYVEVDAKQYRTIEDILDAKLSSPLGMQVSIRDVATVETGTSPNSIARENGKMVVTISANITESDVAKVSKNLEQKVDQLNIPTSVDVKFGGVTEQINETFTQLGLAMLAAIAIVYLVLVLTFGGGLAPFAIMFSLPFAIIGSLVALWIAGETLSVSALMGALMLIGIVVTNAIVLIDRVIHKENEGLSTREALLEAGGTRLRPILMTALATIGALLPLAFGFESAGIISKGLGVTVIGGLISSTVLTLLIVPIIYELLMKRRRKSKQEVVS
ncbi:MAG: efflux RND transporter permease subunit [Candidatus Cohnella colombiensis]|uniref:Efflux RND transporter permease subunit n=1 Tax=Candidatus Cohnella colombiensis TaxID=3121368 RepID=A0AA95F0U2_9BACL|nr:MAG: efflux RND transporter permease subunit [Cohnella sp.]